MEEWITPSSCPKSVASKIQSFPSFYPCLPKLSLAAVSPLGPLPLPPNSILQPVELGQKNSFNFAYIIRAALGWLGRQMGI